jgi:hypothetical protein
MSNQFRYNPLTGRLDLVGDGSGGSGDVVMPSTILAKAIAPSVAASVKTTVVTLAAAVTDRYITAIFCSGMEYAKWFLVRNSADEIIQRTGPDRDQPFQFASPWKIPAGDVIDVKVEHFVTGETPDFEASIMGY